MRRLLIPGILLALFATLTWSDLALAGSCGSKPHGAHSAGKSLSAQGAGQCAGKAHGTHSADHCKGSAAAKAACPPGCSPADKVACPPGCPPGACAGHGTSTARAGGDFFLASYVAVEQGLLKGCSHSTQRAVDAWREGLKDNQAGAVAAEHAEALAKLQKMLGDWPTELEQQRTSFADLSEWTIGYCELYPDRAAGTSVASCPSSGHRWVQTDGVTGNPYSG